MAKPSLVILPGSPPIDQVLRELKKFADQFGEVCVGQVIEDVAVDVAETAIPHGLKSRAKYALALPHAGVMIWRTRAPDTVNVYLQASAAANCTVWVF
jgi:hypothetical protein